MNIVRTLALSALFILLAGVPNAHAVAIYDALQNIDTFDRRGFYLDVGGGGALKTGNTDFKTIAGSAYAGYRRNRNVFLVSSLAEYTEAKGAPVANNSLEHVRYRFYLDRHDTWATEAFVQHERDIFKRIRLRGIGGGALRYALPALGPVHVAAGVGAFAETIRINATAKAPDSGARYDAVRNSDYLTLAIVPASGGLFGFTTYYQPRVDNFADYRASGKVFIEAKAADMVKLEVYSGLAYDVSPASAVKKTDTSSGFKVSIELEPPKPSKGDECPPSIPVGAPVDATNPPPAAD